MKAAGPPGPTLRVAALEIPQRFGEVPSQLGVVDHALGCLPGVDLVLLPETILTGYVSPTGDADLRPFAEALDGPTAARLSAMARLHGVALAGPLVEQAGDRTYNTLVLYDRTGDRVGHWRKRHPWIPERWATPGDLGTPVVRVGALRVTAAICYDIHFLADDAPEALAEADVLLFPSAWVQGPGETDSREGTLSSLARASGVWIVNANWGVSDPPLGGQGGSMVVSPAGAVVDRIPPGAPRGAAVYTVTARRRPAEG